jgi:hypothetical protein
VHTTKGAAPLIGRQNFSAFFLKYSPLLLDMERCEYRDEATDLRSSSDEIGWDLSNRKDPCPCCPAKYLAIRMCSSGGAATARWL